MADLRISELPRLLPADVEAGDDLAVADYSSSETRRLTVKGLVQQGITLADDGTIPGAKLVDNSVTALQIGPDAVGASELADGAVDTAAIQDLAVTNAKVAAGTLTGDRLVADTLTSREIGPDAITASELADNSVDTAAIGNGAVTDAKLASGIDGAKLTDGTVTNAKLATGIDGGKLVANSVGATQIGPDAITASQLADNSVDTAAVIDGAITDAKLASGIDGGKLTAGTVADAALAAGINGSKLSDGTVSDSKITELNGSKLTASSVPATSLGTVTDRGLDQSSGSIGHTNTVTAGTRSGITFDGQGHITGTAALAPSDLPVATTTAAGVVSVPADSGLQVSGTGQLDHQNAITAGSRSGITYDEHGHISSTRALIGTDLPAATATTLGGVSVPSGQGLEVSGGGAVSHSVSPVAPGVYPKVTVDQYGHVTAGVPLQAADIPSLDASKITTGTFGTALIGDRSVTLAKLADYSISYIQEAMPPLTGNHIGCLWYQESTAGLHMWNGNSWMPISIGRLSQENLRYCGTIDATTGLITGVTSFGTAAGYSIGDALKNASDQLTGTYFVVDVPGSSIPQTPSITYDNGDWVLCNGAAAGYVRIDTLSGGGGGGANRLNELLDVTITSPTDGQMFVYTGAGQWANTNDVVGGTY